ncbi:hypothetical protein L195_g047169 [Trifolium pratense]|uniref:Uncharacterized protein n=1 Tax=Trifolium pratense TaxID=57577 RepID=A0A2K3MJP4_TRIPR|nr:hypothetical protein L195_g047169 [Trifolium pratense]
MGGGRENINFEFLKLDNSWHMGGSYGCGCWESSYANPVKTFAASDEKLCQVVFLVEEAAVTPELEMRDFPVAAVVRVDEQLDGGGFDNRTGGTGDGNEAEILSGGFSKGGGGGVDGGD